MATTPTPTPRPAPYPTRLAFGAAAAAFAVLTIIESRPLSAIAAVGFAVSLVLSGGLPRRSAFVLSAAVVAAVAVPAAVCLLAGAW